MIRTKVGSIRRRALRGSRRTLGRTRARARRRLGRTGARRLGRVGQRLRRLLALGLPTAWGAVAVTYKLVCPLAQQNGLGARIATCAVFFAVGTGLVLHVRRGLLRELRQIRKVAGAAQGVLLRPLPPRVDGLAVAAAQFSADRGAGVGGDLYEVIGTEHGVRVVMGDVRGHGLAAIGTVAAVLGSFREAVHDEPELPGVLRRLERAMSRHLRERAKAEHPSSGLDPDSPVAEEFVTVLLLEIAPDGEVRALNCGHPWPYLLRTDEVPAGVRGAVEHLGPGDPLPPLGLFPLPAELPVVPCGRLLPGEALFLHTDGVEDARDGAGRFFPLTAVLTDTVRARPASPKAVLATLLTRLLAHADGFPGDDVAVLVLRNDREESLPARDNRMAHHSAP
ncbi:serine phosphatase RsbU (regulator of sigma subunit) [Streptomyces sp. V3I8]|uniref:PP2C family protein-serine/threonine phosphatase n=1 Tax=Streptomyces sp. V3I8 TaxID=3042279 RepID=UPI002780B5AB|nr:PP2C family protein-serine/threonine phosphatase [Streptomyces sp. V3I8]MDQ1039839.1 serine phosphatase RsbU (regulator of sigma subunit) [Streptomyces sp. V3I8]